MPDNFSDDPFLDEHSHVDRSFHPFEDIQASFTPVTPALLPEDLEEQEQEAEAEQPEAEVPSEPTPAPVAVEPAPEPEGVETYQTDDGCTVTIRKGPTGWEVILDTNTGRTPERFTGRTKNDVLLALAKGKANASKKIDSLNRKIKLGGTNEWTSTNSTPSDPQASADISQREADLEASLRKVNTSIDQQSTAVAAGFLQEYPEWATKYKTMENYRTLVQSLSKRYLNNTRVRDNNIEKIIRQLFSIGHWTVDEISDAFQDLRDDELLVQVKQAAVVPTQQPAPTPHVAAPVHSPQPPAASVAAPVPQPQPTLAAPRTVAPARPRAGLGIRANEVTAPVVARASAIGPPSDDEIENMSPEELQKAIQREISLHRPRR